MFVSVLVQVYYLDSIDFGTQNVQELGYPRIAYYSKEKIKELIELDKPRDPCPTSISYGATQVCIHLSELITNNFSCNCQRASQFDGHNKGLYFFDLQATRKDSPSNPQGNLAKAELARRYLEEKKKKAASSSAPSENDICPDKVLPKPHDTVLIVATAVS